MRFTLCMLYCLLFCWPASAVEIVSIGGACNVARATRHNHLRHAAFPFDWLITSTPALFRAFEDDFDHMLEPSDLYLSGDGKSAVDGYGLIYIHDFPTIKYPNTPIDGEIMPVHGLSNVWREAIPVVRAKHYRRVQRLLRLLRNGQPVALVRYNGMDRAQAEKLIHLLRTKFPNAKAHLVVIGSSLDFLEPWDLPHVSNMYISEKDIKDWQGPVWAKTMMKVAELHPEGWSHPPSPSKGYVLTLPIYNPGFFSVFNTVIGALDLYDKGEIAGLSINFERDGWYFDPEKGNNWWNYYFEPIALGDKQSVVTGSLFPTYQKIQLAYGARFDISRERAHELISKYIRIRPEIQRKIDDFTTSFFGKSDIIGVHYRGTDKVEVEHVSYDDVSKCVQNALASADHRDIKVFVATDDDAFATYMKNVFGDLIVMRDSLRSNGSIGVHMRTDFPPYLKGEEALIDCLLLSSCSKLIKTASNLSDCSLQFNPSIVSTKLNMSYSE